MVVGDDRIPPEVSVTDVPEFVAVKFLTAGYSV
jgi:hypothetical protein